MAAVKCDVVASSSWSSLQRCVGNVDRFLSEFWGRRPLYRKGADSQRFEDLLSMEDVDLLISSTARPAPDISLIKDGEVIEPRTYTWFAGRGSEGYYFTDAGVVYAQFHDGATITLASLQRYWLPLAKWCRQLELGFTMPIQANAYLTPPGSQGAALHVDTHDTMALQVFGHKHWEIYDAVDTLPLPNEEVAVPSPGGPPILTADLHPGDCLYIPRGYPHLARTSDTASLHITIGVLVYTWIDVMREIVARASTHPSFREALPVGFAHGGDNLASTVASRLREMAGWMGDFDPEDVADWVARNFWSNRRPVLTGHLTQLLGLESLTDSSVVRRRAETVCRLFQAGTELSVVLGDRELKMPAALVPVLQGILEKDMFSVSDLAEHLDEPSRLMLVARLITEGLLERAGPH